jgi:hypothetical protein
MASALADGFPARARYGALKAAKLAEKLRIVQKLALARVDNPKDVQEHFALGAHGLAIGDARQAEQFLDEAARIVVARDLETSVRFADLGEFRDHVRMTERRFRLAHEVENRNIILVVAYASVKLSDDPPDASVKA